MCWTVSLGILVTYMKLHETHEFLMGLSVVATVSATGIGLGLWFGRISEAMFWSVLGALTAFLCAVGEPLTHPSFQYAWPMVGALTAATAVMLDRHSLLTRMIVGAVLGSLVLGLFSLLPRGVHPRQAWIEIACGPVAGAIMVGVVWILETLRSWRNYSRSMLTMALTIGVIGGNAFGRYLGLL